MASFVRATLVASLATLVGLGSLALAHPPQPPVEDVPDPWLRPAYLVSTGEVRTMQSNTTGNYYQPQDMRLGLSFNPAVTSAESRSYSMKTPARVLVCLQSQVSPCGHQPFHSEAALVDSLQDIPLQPRPSVHGMIALTWSYSGSMIVTPLQQPPTVYLIAELLVGDQSYGAYGFTLSGSRGDKEIPLSFGHLEQCHHDRGDHAKSCSEPEDDSENVSEVWAHDVVLRLRLQRVDYQYVSLGDSFTVTLQTGGRSWLELYELPPPPPVEEEAVVVNGDGELNVTWEDSDGNGQHDLDEIAFVPTPGLAAAAAAFGGLAWIRRRRSG